MERRKDGRFKVITFGYCPASSVYTQRGQVHRIEIQLPTPPLSVVCLYPANKIPHCLQYAWSLHTELRSCTFECIRTQQDGSFSHLLAERAPILKYMVRVFFLIICSHFRSWGENWNLMPSDKAIVFIDNHDNQRGHGAGGAAILTFWNPRYEARFMRQSCHLYSCLNFQISWGRSLILKQKVTKSNLC